MVLKLSLLVVGLVSTSAFASPFPDADTVVPEAEDLAQTDPKVQSVPLLRRARSNEDHKRLVDWISHTHTRKEHPQILIDEGATISSGTKLVTETALKNADLVEYYGQVQVGGQSFAVVFDTGSGIFWVPGERCKEEACQKHEQLKLSKLINVEDGDVDIKYGTGHMSGQRAVGSVHVGGVKVKNQDFLMSTQEHGEVFSNGRFDGVFGFGRKQLASILKRPGDGKDRAAPFYINAIHQNLLQKPEFSFFVSAEENKPGAVVLGGTNPKLYKGDITWHEGKSPSYWMMDIDSIRIGDKGKSPEEALLVIDTKDKEGLGFGSLRGIADSGTSLLVGPDKFIKPILEHVNVAEDCSNMKDLKTLHISMTDVTGKLIHYKLTPEQYVMNRGGMCKTGIAVMHLQLPGTHPIMIMGDTFLRAHYSVYNHEKNQVGFAPANHEHEDDGHLPSLVAAN